MDGTKVLKLILMYFLVLFWTGIVSIRLLIGILWNRGAYFYTKPRPKKPTVLTEGWTHKFVKLSDVTLHYVSSGSPTKPLMLMLHGFPEFWYSWRYQIKDLAENYHVVAVDMRGYGESDKPKGSKNYSLDLLVKDIKELVPALGYNSCVLVAHDWGGVVAWQLAATQPDLLDRLIILNAPNSDVMTQFLREKPKQLLKSWYIFFFQTPFLPEIMIRSKDFQMFDAMTKSMKGFSSEDLEATKYTFSQPDALTCPINYYRQNLTPRFLGDPKPPTIIEPKTLIIWGTNDVALETGLAHSSAKCCRDARVELVDGASHFVHEDRPKEVSQMIRKWLDED